MNADTDEFQRVFDVSRETIDRLNAYKALLLKWNRSINLISKTTEDHVWSRHFGDCATCFQHCPDHADLWVDMGSGAGLPGIVVAILAKEKRPHLLTRCVESDRRKAAFLQTVTADLSLNCEVLAHRVEDTDPQKADVVSARALAPLSKLLQLTERHLSPSGVAVFPKGAKWQAEVDAGKCAFRFQVQAHLSHNQEGSAILVIGDIGRA